MNLAIDLPSPDGAKVTAGRQHHLAATTTRASRAPRRAAPSIAATLQFHSLKKARGVRPEFLGNEQYYTDDHLSQAYSLEL